jgi:hypothetical protein
MLQLTAAGTDADDQLGSTASETPHCELGGCRWWVQRSRGCRREPLYKGGGEGFLVHGEKKGGDREAAGDDFIPYMTIFCYWGLDRKAAEVALMWLPLGEST